MSPTVDFGPAKCPLCGKGTVSGKYEIPISETEIHHEAVGLAVQLLRKKEAEKREGRTLEEKEMKKALVARFKKNQDWATLILSDARKAFAGAKLEETR